MSGSSSPSGQAAPLLSAQEVADWLGVGRGWVYQHADRLQVLRLGGDGGRLRFDPEKVREALSSCSARRGSETPEEAMAKRNAPTQQGRGAGTGAPLLPIRGPTTPPDDPAPPASTSQTTKETK